MNNHIYFIVGPTACGKSDVALYIARTINNTKIISADSMQVYRGMDIGTAKVPKSVRSKIPHYLIDIIDPWEPYSLCKYVNEVNDIISELNNKDNLLLIVGGTGLYIRGLLHGVFDGPGADWDLRNRLTAAAREKGPDYLLSILKTIDPVSAEKLHKEDHKRIIRAIEVYEKTGIAISTLQKKYYRPKPDFTYSIFLINRSKEDLHCRIEHRIETMFDQGLVNEICSLQKDPKGMSKQAVQALGYKETLQYLNNEIDLSQAIELIKRNTKKFAKRQMTWFKSFNNTIRIDVDPNDSIDTVGSKVLQFIKTRRTD